MNTEKKETQMPKVHNKYKNTAPVDAVYIGRPSKWGNPFVIGKDGSRSDVVAKYEEYILGKPELLAQLHELKGKDLVCFCAPQACHGDVLVHLANNSEEEITMDTNPTPTNPEEGSTMNEKPVYAIAFTGHRPNKIGGYDYTNPQRYAIRVAMKETLQRAVDKYGETHKIFIITGGALGVDQDAARVAYQMELPYIVAQPCKNQESTWPKTSQLNYKQIVDRAHRVVLVGDGTYDELGTKCMQDRNIWMVDHCDALIAVWDGSSGGTANCVNYAQSVNKPIVRINPDDYKDNGGGNKPKPTPNNPKEGPKMEAEKKKTVPPADALVKCELLSPEEIAWITNKLEEKILPHLVADVSNYAKGRMRTWMPYEAPLDSANSMNRPFVPGILDDEIWQWVVDLCAKHGFTAQTALISKGGNIKPHRDTTYAAAWAMGINLGVCNWHIASKRDSASTDYTMNLTGGEVFKFNSKHVHAVTDAAPDRWAINIWAIANTKAANDANIHERIDEMMQKHPEVAEFVDFHKPNISNKEEKIVNQKTASFKGTFLSNFWPSPIEYKGVIYPSVENFYQAMKTEDEDVRQQFASITAAQAKAKSKQIVLHDRWNQEFAEKVMSYALLKKFIPGSQLAEMLLATGDEELVELNYWHDNIWGSCTCGSFACSSPGQNQLGVLLMQVRETLRGGGEPAPTNNNPKEGPTMDVNPTPTNQKEEAVNTESIEQMIDRIIKKPKEAVTMKTKLPNGIGLTAGQANAYNLALNTEENLCITGNAGVGKTFTVNLIIEELRKKYGHAGVGVFASTGIAATHIDGVTYHSGLCMNPGTKPRTIATAMTKDFNWPRINPLKVIIIDEVSMMPAGDVDRMDQALRLVFKKHLPFGGKRVIFVGDFMQLPPIENKEMETGMAFVAKAWRDGGVKTAMLTEVVRQKDPQFFTILNLIRQGIWVKDFMAPVIQSRMNIEMPENCTYLYSKNVDVDARNRIRLAAIEAEQFNFIAEDRNPVNWEGVENVKYWDTNCIAPRRLEIKVGAFVMITKNNHDEGVVNGDVGTIVEIKYNEEDPTKSKIIMSVERTGANYLVDYVTFGDMGEDDDVSDPIYRKQFAIRLAYAVTIHKSQGMTLDRLVVDIGDCFADGQMYVALSRATSLEGLFILDFHKKGVRASSQALEFYGLPGNVSGEAALAALAEYKEPEYKFDNLGEDDEDNGGTTVSPVKPNNNNGGGTAVSAPKKEDQMIQSEEVKEVVDNGQRELIKQIEEMISTVDKQTQTKEEMMDVINANNSEIKEYLIIGTRKDVGYDKTNNAVTDGFRQTYRVITNDLEHYFGDLIRKNEIELIEHKARGVYHYAFLNHVFAGKRFKVEVGALFTDGEANPALFRTYYRNDKPVHLPLPDDYVFGWADFDKEVVVHCDDFNLADAGICIGNSAKATKRFTEIIRCALGTKVNVKDEEKENNGLARILVMTDEMIQRFNKFAHLSTEERRKVTFDGVSIVMTQFMIDTFAGNPNLDKKDLGKLIKDMKKNKLTNVTLRVVTNIDETPCLIKGNAIKAASAKKVHSLLWAALPELDGQWFDIITSHENVKKEIGTDGRFEVITMEPHHGPNLVRSNDQTLAQFYGIKGLFDPEELLTAYNKFWAEAIVSMEEGNDIAYLANIHTEKPSTEAEMVNHIKNGSVSTLSLLERQVAALHDAGLSIGVSQTIMAMRAGGVRVSQLSKSNIYDDKGFDWSKPLDNFNLFNIFTNWQAPAREKKSALFMPWTYRAYVMTKEVLWLAGYNIDLAEKRSFYHAETQTYAMCGIEWCRVAKLLGGADLDDEIMIHERKIKRLNGEIVDNVDFLLRTPNDWAEFAFVDSMGESGEARICYDEKPVLDMADFEKFKIKPRAGKLPSSKPGSKQRPMPAVYDEVCSRYNWRAAANIDLGVGGQVKAKMLWYYLAVKHPELNLINLIQLPCPNEDMIDAIQQCKGTIEDMQTLNNWEKKAVTTLLKKAPAMDAYHWESRNMDGTVNALTEMGYIVGDSYTEPLAAEDSSIVNELMVPRQLIVHQTYQKMMDVVNSQLVEIMDLQDVFENEKQQNEFMAMVKTKADQFRSGNSEEVAINTAVNLIKRYKKNEEEFNMYILRLARASYLQKMRYIQNNWNKTSNFDQWLYWGIEVDGILIAELFAKAIVWYRERTQA